MSVTQTGGATTVQMMNQSVTIGKTPAMVTELANATQTVNMQPA